MLQTTLNASALPASVPGQSDQKAEITESLKELRTLVNNKVEKHEKLQFIVVTSEEWTAANGCLTPTMKIRRSAIEDRTKGKLDEWYDSNNPVIWA